MPVHLMMLLKKCHIAVSTTYVTNHCIFITILLSFLLAGADVKSEWKYLRNCWLNEREKQNKEDPSGTATNDLKKNQRRPFVYFE